MGRMGATGFSPARPRARYVVPAAGGFDPTVTCDPACPFVVAPQTITLLTMPAVTFNATKAPVVPVRPCKGLKRASKAAPKVSNVAQSKEMMVWTPNDNKCALATL